MQELFLLDPAPKPLGDYARRGEATVVPCTPLTTPGELQFVEP